MQSSVARSEKVFQKTFLFFAIIKKLEASRYRWVFAIIFHIGNPRCLALFKPYTFDSIVKYLESSARASQNFQFSYG